MWQRHWGLVSNPFDGRPERFVETPTHAEALARLVHAIESGGRSARLVAGPGLGKSTVLSRALAATRSPTRRFARGSGLADGPSLLAELAEGLGFRVASGASRGAAWRALAEAARLCRWQALQVVLAVDDCQALAGRADWLDLERLAHLDPHPTSRITVLRVGRPVDPASDPHGDSGWELPIHLAPLTRSEAALYLANKLESAGRPEPAFTPRALTRLHVLAMGSPRALDRLAQLSLVAGAVRGLEVVTPEVVEASALEYLPGPYGAIPA